MSLEIFHFLFSQEIAIESLHVFDILLISGLIIVPSILLGYPFLGALGYSKYANKSVMYASVVHIVGIFFLYINSNITIYSVSIMVVFTQLFDLLYRIFAIKKQKLWQ